VSAEPDLDALLASARRRLEALELYPKPLTRRVRVVVWPWFFRFLWFKRYVAYALITTIVLKETPAEYAARRGVKRLEDLLVHELCHVWQTQHHPFRMAVALVRYRYRDNPYEQEARRAAAPQG
jgi:hypothetical protein